MHLATIKDSALIYGGGILGLFNSLFGGFDEAFIILLGLITLDFITGMLTAIHSNKSTKTAHGGLSSNAGYKGLLKKMMILVIVIVANFMDVMTGLDYIRSAVVMAFSINEIVSIIENAGLIGLPIPNIIKNTIEVLKKDNDEKAS